MWTSAIECAAVPKSNGVAGRRDSTAATTRDVMLRVSAPLVYIRGRTAPRRQWVIATLVARGDAVVRLREYYQDPNAPRADDVLPAAFAAVRNVAGEVLLVRRIDDGYWELPGGRLEVGESAAQAVIREVAEESGVVIALVGISGVYSDPTHVLLDPDGTVHQQLALCFHAIPSTSKDLQQPRPDGIERKRQPGAPPPRW